ncbi:hypothetical protein DFH08DRAFT_884221 [Mycena albidolilacea]|uniref:Uncharacterized protein n=1 Tax=Mycena albidolilacea TaxID=1033008 RepID=A0AAD7EIZ0_9AGAR|nr:hypothetical protein DFH08DRAFT_884221 [Mycena albidolilacea]
MHLARSLWAVALLCSVVRGGLTNFTLDDTSPAITYTQAPVIRCAPGTGCDPDWTARLHNGTSSTTSAPIIIPFIVAGPGTTRETTRPLICTMIYYQGVRCTYTWGYRAHAFSTSTGGS